MQLSLEPIFAATRIARIGNDPLRTLVAAVEPKMSLPPRRGGDDSAELAAWFGKLRPDDHPVLFERVHDVLKVVESEDPEALLRAEKVPIPSSATIGEVVASIAAQAPATLDVLTAHVAISESQTAKAFTGYVRHGAPQQVRLDDKRIAKLAEACRTFFEGRGGGKYCQVAKCLDGTRTALLISSGSALRTERLIETDDVPGLRRFRNGKDSIVLVSADGRELHVSARSLAERQFLVGQVGAVFFNDERAFIVADRYNLEPICQPGFAKKLARATSSEIAAVTLTHLALAARDEHGSRMDLRADDVLAFADEREIALDRFEPKEATFEIVPVERQGRRRFRIKITGANKRRASGPMSAEVIEQLIDNLGLLRE